MKGLLLPMEFDFTRAEQMLPKHLTNMAYNLRPTAHFLPDGTFWYCREFALPGTGTIPGRGTQFLRVQATSGASEPAFDHAGVAAALSRAGAVKSGELEVSASALPFDTFDFVDDGAAIRVTVDNARWQVSLDTYKAHRVRGAQPATMGNENRPRTPSFRVKPAADHEVVSPDGEWAAYLRGHNLAIRSLCTGEARLLTRNGKKDYAYAARPDFYGSKTVDLINGQKPRPMVLWSPDSTRLLTHRLDQRHVPLRPVLQYVPDGDAAPAQAHFVHYPLAGTEPLPTVEHLILGVDGQRIDLKQEPLGIRNTDALLSPHWQNLWWAEDGAYVYYIHPTRGYKSMQFFEADAATGAVRLVYEEVSDTFMDLDMRVNKRNIAPDVRVLRRRDAFLWASQRDGFYHLYLHSLRDGRQLRAVTAGEWVVRELVDVDEAEGWVYFLGAGREPGRDPYYQHLYRVQWEGGEPELLTPEAAEHDVQISPCRRYFVDTHSRVDQAPVTVLRAADGSIIRTLEEADISRLVANGFVLPEPFTVKAADGVTDLYGILIKPTAMDPNKAYPLVEYEYGGVHTFITPKAFSLGAPWAQSLATLGFAVMTMDGRGTPGRSKAFHDFSAERLGQAAGLVDHAAAIPQLAALHPWIDVQRVGIHGFSGGGYGSARAILMYPDVYRVAVACCGDHDNRLYDSTWWERYMGLGDANRFEAQDNQSLAANLQGHLLLIHGDVDDNVHPNLTMRLADALIRADKEFDLLIMPNRGHALSRDIYVAHRTWVYFLRHL